MTGPVYERTLTCISCGTPTVVFEASNTESHVHINPATFKCNDCHRPKR